MPSPKSFISYVGGKSKLTDQIIPLIPSHDCYAEVFAGAAWLLFKKNPSKVEIVNDINADLVTLYRVVQHHIDELLRYLTWALVARDEFKRWKNINPANLTDIQRAARFYYLLKTSYGSRIINPAFSINTTAPSHLNAKNMEQDLRAAHARLARVYIENIPYAAFIARFDKPTTFFYLDPPYYQCENYYGDGIFHRDDFEKLRNQLLTIQGSFCLSINDVPEIRELFKQFRIKEVSTHYSMGKNKTKAQELLIMNYDLPA